jgi:hypothetical protein
MISKLPFYLTLFQFLRKPPFLFFGSAGPCADKNQRRRETEHVRLGRAKAGTFYYNFYEKGSLSAISFIFLLVMIFSAIA